MPRIRLRFLSVLIRAGALLAALPGMSPPAAAAELLVEGEARLTGADPDAARAAAIRAALAEAARGGTLHLQSTLSTGDARDGVRERTQLRSERRILGHELLEARASGDTLRVRLRVTVADGDGDEAPGLCRGGHLRRVLVAGFPLERPEELLAGELDGYARLTARELAARLAGRPLLVDHDGRFMLQDGLPERVVGDLPPTVQALHRVRETAQRHRAQTLLTGLFRSFALDAGRNRRTLELDVLLIDGLTGSCVARTRLSRVATGQVVLPGKLAFGSPAFYATDLGRAYGELLDEAAAWAAQIAPCLPLTARIVRVEGGRAYFDAGAEQSVAVGDTFTVLRPSPAPLTAPGGELLGVERQPLGELVVRHVYPRFAIGELQTPPAVPSALPKASPVSRPTLLVGDELHAF